RSVECLDSFFFQAEDGIRDYKVTGVQTCALPICEGLAQESARLPGRRAGVHAVPGALRRPAALRRRERDVPGPERLGRGEDAARSEERRVGKECRSRWARYHDKKRRIPLRDSRSN